MENIEVKSGQEGKPVEEKVLVASETKVVEREFSIKELTRKYEAYKSIVDIKNNELRDAELHLSGLKSEVRKSYEALEEEVPEEFLEELPK